MQNRPSELLKNAAGELSQYVCHGHGDAMRARELLQQLNVAAPAKPMAEPAAPARRDTDIGIWKRSFTSRGAVYERDPKKKRQWHQWANVQKLHPKRENKRVILLGESVARGFFYDPHYTVANELEAVLNSVEGLTGFEVTDLAKTNCGMQELLNLARSCRALDPDAIVIFAGNNWHHELYDSFTQEDYDNLWQLLKKQATAEVKKFLEDKWQLIIHQCFKKLHSIFPPDELSCVFIIPGFNLADWKNSYYGLSVPWLSGEAAARWFACKEKAEKALQNKDYNRVAEAANEMVRLDALHPYGYQLLAAYCLSHDRPAEARKNLEICRDAGILHRGDNNYPVCREHMREAIKKEAGGFAVVDAQALYNAHAKDGIAGRDCFMDYCHLTIRGIKITMSHTASVLLDQLHLKKPVRSSALQPSNEVMAIAHLSAAIHNAHRDQDYEIVFYHCKKAISYAEEVKEQLLQILDFSSRKASTALCRSFEEIIVSGKMQQYDGGFALQHPAGNKLADITLTNAITEALASVDIHTDQKLAKMRLREHGVRERKVNLLESFYSKTSYNNFPPLNITPFYMRSRHTDSAFRFFADAAQPLSFDLIYRVPYETTGMILIMINEGNLIEIPVSGKWERAEFTVPAGQLNNGVNHLTIQWPRRGMQTDEDANLAPAENLLNTLSPVMGELHAFTVVEKS